VVLVAIRLLVTIEVHPLILDLPLAIFAGLVGHEKVSLIAWTPPLATFLANGSLGRVIAFLAGGAEIIVSFLVDVEE